jgi:hypothetical protein
MTRQTDERMVEETVIRARTSRKALRRLAEAADAALIAVGKAAKRRQQRRVVRAGLKKAGKAAIMAGAAAATIIATGAVIRQTRRHRKETAR